MNTIDRPTPEAATTLKLPTSFGSTEQSFGFSLNISVRGLSQTVSCPARLEPSIAPILTAVLAGVLAALGFIFQKIWNLDMNTPRRMRVRQFERLVCPGSRVRGPESTSDTHRIFTTRVWGTVADNG